MPHVRSQIGLHELARMVLQASHRTKCSRIPIQASFRYAGPLSGMSISANAPLISASTNRLETCISIEFWFKVAAIVVDVS